MQRSADIVLPCFNPNSRWHQELLSFNDFIAGRYAINYIIVNDGSKTGDINAQLSELKNNAIAFDFISYDKNRGKGFALRKGVSVAMNDMVVYTDIDFPFKNESMLDLLDTLSEGAYDVVAGYRDKTYYASKMSVFRRSLSRSFRFFITDIIRLPVSDTQCGLKGFNKKGREKFLQTKTDRYLFDFEFIYASGKDKNIKIGTVKAELKENVVFSRMRPAVLLQEAINLFSILLSKKI